MERNPETVVTVALAQMAVFRGAEVSPQTLQLFARRLLAERCHPDDVVKACGLLEVEERGEGELAFPALGTLLARIGSIAHRRREQEKQAQMDAEYVRMQIARWNVPTAEELEEREASRRRFREAFELIRSRGTRVA